MVHFTITCTLLAMIKWSGIPFLNGIPESFFKWVLPPLFVFTVLSGQFSLESLKVESPRLLASLKWHRALGIGAAVLATWTIFTFPAKPSEGKEAHRFVIVLNSLFSLPGLVMVLIILTATIGGLLVHTYRIGVPAQI
jgi:uncharacterized membrane protein